MRVLITGTAGFIGFHLANRLTSKGIEILGLDSINDYYDVNLKYGRLNEAGFEEKDIDYGSVISGRKNNLHRFIQAELEDKDLIFKIFAEFKPEFVVHLAAQAGVRYSLSHPDAYINSNITGFLNILEACRSYPVNHLVYASSSSVYGLNKNMPFNVHESVDHPVSLYAVSKKSNELMAHSYSHLFGIPSTGLRFFTVYGPWGRPDMALFIFTKAILKGEAIDVYNFGNMERDFTYIDDIIDGIERIIPVPAKAAPSWKPENPDPAMSACPYRIYNIGHNAPVRLLDFIQAIEKETGKKAVMNMKDIQPGDVEKTWADVNDLISDFSYKPETSVESGIKNFVNWFREYYHC